MQHNIFGDSYIYMKNHHNVCHEQIHCFQKILSTSLFIFIFIILFMCVITHMQGKYLTKFNTFHNKNGEDNGNPVLLPGESQGRGSLVGCRLWGCTESDTTEAT